MPAKFELIAPCFFGCESTANFELRRIGAEDIRVSDGRLTFRGGADMIAAANLNLRTVERVMLLLNTYTATTFDEHCVMANPSRKKRKRKASVVGAVLKLLFPLLLLSMLAAYIANQVALSSKKAELDTLQEQIDQQKTQNEEMQRILSGDSDDVTEWVARDSYNYAAANERIFVDVTGN